ncbi:MAG TPA: hypothetical protein VNW06_11215 [Cytophagaceae bacterium]|jgi:hypothetical protein|nr:hypothetical protein [Cytophagaceae bacterium]
MKNNKPLFWKDIEMYTARINKINSLLNIIDRQPPEIIFAISNDFHALPAGSTFQKHFIDFMKRKNNESLSEELNYYVISNNKLINGLYEGVYLFTRDTFDDYTLFNDYFSQVLLLKLQEL